MRQPQLREGLLGEVFAAEVDDDEREEQAERRGGLDPARVEAAAVVRRMLGDVGGGAAVLAAESQALEQAQRDEEDGRATADARVGRQARRRANVEAPITVMVMRKVYLRPTRSPMRPKTSAPNGRTRKPAA